jgi:hypothetical protein
MPMLRRQDLLRQTAFLFGGTVCIWKQAREQVVMSEPKSTAPPPSPFLPTQLFKVIFPVGDQVPNQIFPIKTLARVAPRHDDWAMQKLSPREVLFQAVNLVDQWLKSMLISKS